MSDSPISSASNNLVPASIFQDDDIKFSVTCGAGRYVVAGNLDNQVVGRGLPMPLYRDYTWKYIARVVKSRDDVTIVYLDTTDTKENRNINGSMHEIVITRVVERSITFKANELVIVSTDQTCISRPSGRRRGKVTRYIDEPLAEATPTPDGMRVLYSDEPNFGGGLSIFLAGPTPRSTEVKSWRPQAVEIFQRIGFQGTVLIPERRDWTVKFDYTDQVGWEKAGLSNCTVAVFWVPRNMQNMPALDTNVEFGVWISRAPEKVIYGRPDTAERCRYLDWLYKDATTRTPFSTLEETLQAAVVQATATV